MDHPDAWSQARHKRVGPNPILGEIPEVSGKLYYRASGTGRVKGLGFGVWGLGFRV